MMIDCIDPNIQSIFEETDNYLNLQKDYKAINTFKKVYSQNTSDEVSWLQLCNDSEEIGAPKYIFLFLYTLLKRGLYINDYSKELYELVPSFDLMYSQQNRKFNVEHLFCKEQIKNLIIYKHNSNECKFAYSYYVSNNNYIKQEVIDFLSAPRKTTRWHSRNILKVFELSLGKYESSVCKYQDFNENTFWTQIEYYKDYFCNDSESYDYSIRAICCFYRWLVNKYSDYNFFKDSFTITKYLLFSNKFTEYIKNDYYFTAYNPQNKIGDHNKICFIIRGMENMSTRMVSEDYFGVDISNVSESFYRESVLNYILSTTNITIVTWSGQTYYMCEGLQFLINLKTQSSYPNPNIKYLTNQEAVFLKNYFRDENLKISTCNNKIGAIRRFLLWCKDTGTIDFDDMFFEYLKQYEEPSQTSGASIPDDKLALIGTYMAEDSKKDHMAKIAYAIFHLAIQTEFRINQICHLKTDCLRPSVKPGQYIVYTNSKTSYGRKNSYVITELTYHILMNIIEDTEEKRDRCNIESIKDYIFLYDSTNSGIALYRPTQFNNYIKSVCNELGFETLYTASNLRDTHMTKAFEHILRNGKSDLEMRVLSKHKHLDTTKNHYIEIELEKMLEATYGVTIGTELIDTDSKILDDIPEQINNKESDVEGGCGKCSAPSCVIMSSLPCMACKHFITTVKHEKHFVKAIQNVDRLIAQTNNNHDKEDLVTVKQLYVLYLKAIYKHKEGM